MESLVQERGVAVEGGLWSVERVEAGVVLVRGCGGAEPEPAGWRELLAGLLREAPGVAAVGAKRLLPDGQLFSMGELIVHPKGFHHLGHGVDGQAFRFPEEVDAVAGGVLAVDGNAFDDVGGAEILQRGPLGPIELCLALRREGGRVITVPHVTVTDTFTPAPDGPERKNFLARFGFDYRAADLEAVRRRHGGTGLLWNLRFHQPPLPFAKYQVRRCMHWRSYEDVEVYRKRADHLVKVLSERAGAGPVLDLGCGDGLFSHLLGLQGLEVIGIDPEPDAIEQAESEVADREYPGRRPRFVRDRGESLPFPDGTFTAVAMLDVIEHLPNPVAVLGQCRRVLADGGQLVISTPAWQYGAWSDPLYHVCEYTGPQLVHQVQACTDLLVTATGQIGGVYRDLIVIAQKPPAGTRPDRPPGPAPEHPSPARAGK